MSTTAYVVPFDAKSPSQALSDIDVPTLWNTAAVGSQPPKVGTSRVFYGVPPSKITAVSFLGDKFSSTTGNERRELLRKSVGSAVNSLKGLDGVSQVAVDASADPHAAAVAAHLALYKFSLKTEKESAFKSFLEPSPGDKINISPLEHSQEWDRGVVYAYSQNLARTLMELPGNMMTPTNFCTRVTAEFAGIPNIEIIVRDKEWASKMGMRTFLSVAQGSAQPPKFLEIHYKGAPSPDAPPLALVGKGITFDSGGISLKVPEDMKLMRGDMGGAASVVSAALAIAKLKLPINLVVLTPLTENMPGPSATKPGDIFYAMNGKTVEVDNTDAEGRLVLADALYYASSTFKPHTVIDVATLTGAMYWALGEVLTGVFSSSDKLWTELHAAGDAEYDRFWRMPLEEDYGPQIYSSNADLCNTGGKWGGSCTAALFLKAFVDGLDRESNPIRWAHVDIAGTMEATRATPYQEKGMTGRSVRGLVEYACRLANSK